MIRSSLRILVAVVLSAIVFASVAWAALALWLDGPDSKILAGTMAMGPSACKHALAGTR